MTSDRQALQIARSTNPGGIDHLSYSAVALYRACSLRYHMKYIAKLPEESVSASLVFGSAFHAALQFHYEQLLVEDEPPGLDILLDVFWESWNAREHVPLQYAKDEDITTIARLADRMLQAFLASDLAMPNGVIVGIEEELRAPIVEDCPDILARLDLLIDTGDELLVVDFKTAKCRWNPTKLAEFAPQLHLYSELAMPVANGKPLKLAFVVLTKAKKPKFTLHQVPHEPESVEQTKRMVQQVWRSVGRGHFVAQPSPRHCPQCPYRRHCYAWRGVRD